MRNSRSDWTVLKTVVGSVFHCPPANIGSIICCDKKKEGRQRTYNVTVRRVHVTTVAVESNKYYIFWVCVCSLSYPACAVLYCHQRPVWLYQLFPHYLIKARFRKKKVTENKMCFDFRQNFCLKDFFLTRTQRDIIIRVHRSSCKVPVILVRF
jgi:hypothetical protein